MLRIDRKAQFRAEYEAVIHTDDDARFDEEFEALLVNAENLLHPDYIADYLRPGQHMHEKPWLHAEFLTLIHIDLSAQFCAERSTRFFGIVSKKTYRFRCWHGTRCIQSDAFWNENLYHKLMEQQKKEPVRVMVDVKSGRTWWMFRDTFYWEGYSAREMTDRQRPESIVLKEVMRMFLEGANNADGIAGKIYRFPGWLSEQQIEAWTEEQYQDQLAQQRAKPVRVLTDKESGKTWWMFRDKFYWEDISARGMIEHQRLESAVMKEVERNLFKRASSPNGIAGKMHEISVFSSEREPLPVRSWLNEWEIGSWTEEQYQTRFEERLPVWIDEKELFPTRKRSWTSTEFSEQVIGFWTEKQYESLVAKQKEEPVLVLMAEKYSHGSWWMFRDQLYWAWVDEELEEDEAKRLFLQGTMSPYGISNETHCRFRYYREGKGIHACKVLTEEQHQTLLTKQKEEPVLVQIDSQSRVGSGTWWMFQDQFHWADEVLSETKIRALFVEGSKSNKGIGRRKYHFNFGPNIFKNREKILFSEILTEEEYQALLVRQRKEPVKIKDDWENERDWWMFKDNFHWTWKFGNYAAGEFIGRDDLKQLFFEGVLRPEGYSVATSYRFQCQPNNEEILSDRVWPAKEYQGLLVQQLEDPVQLLTDWESGRTWWMFRNKFYWEDDDLQEIEVKALLLERIRKKESRIERAIRQMEEDD